MNKIAAKALVKYHCFTKKELHDMLSAMLDAYPVNYHYWTKPNYVNALFDNGSFFNSCVKWLDYKEGINDNETCKEMVAFRVLQCAGKFSKIQIPKKKKLIPEIRKSEKPML